MKNSWYLVFLLIFLSCKEQQARRPIQASPTVTIYPTVPDSIASNALENQKIQLYVAQDSLTTYTKSSDGFWYAFTTKIAEEGQYPKNGDQVEITVEIKDLNHHILYSKEALGTKVFQLGTKTFIPTIEEGIKLMKIGETLTFVIPSVLPLGVLVATDNLVTKTPLILTITLINIKHT